VRRGLVVAVAGEVIEVDLLGETLLRDLIRQRIRSGQRPVDAALGAVGADELDGDAVGDDRVEVEGGGVTRGDVVEADGFGGGAV
jgi:hypothetical protein